MIKSKNKQLLKYGLYFSIAIVFVLGLLGPAIVYFNQNRILGHILKKINSDQSHSFTVEQIHISPFENFPYISIDLENASLRDSLRPDEPLLGSFQHIYVGFDVIDMMKGIYNIKRIHLKNATINLKRYADGANNFTFESKPSEKDSLETAFKLDLDEIELKEVNIHYFDEKGHNEDHFYIPKARSTINLVEDLVQMHLEMTAEIKDMIFEGVDFFREKHINLLGDWVYDTKKGFLSINPSQITIEKSEFELRGSFDQSRNNFLDLELGGRKSNFDLLIALSPPEVGEYLKNYENSGDIYFKGTVVGEIGEDKTPAMNLEFGCKNAAFINPENHKSIRNLDFKGYFTNGAERTLESTEFYLENFKGQPENSSVLAKFRIKNFKEPQLLVDFHANLDLSTIQALYPMPNFEALGGNIKIDISLDEFIDTENMKSTVDRLKNGADSKIVFDKVLVKHKSYPHAIKDLHGKISTTKAGSLFFDEIALQIASSDFRMTGKIVDISNLLHGREQEVDLMLDFAAKRINLFELLSPLDSSANKKNTIDETITDFEFKTELITSSRYLSHSDSLPLGKFFIKDLHFRLKNYPHYISDVTARTDISRTFLNLQKFSGKIDGKPFTVDLSLTNPNSLLHPETSAGIKGHLALDIPLLKLEELLVYKDSSYLPKDTDFKTFRNLNLKLGFQTNNKQLLRFEGMPEGDFNLENLTCQIEGVPFNFDYLRGAVHFENHVITLSNFATKIGHTDLEVSGTLQNYLRPMQDSTKYPHITKIKLKSKFIDLDELMRYKPKPNPENHAHVDTADINIFNYEFPDLYVDAEIGKIVYHKYLLENLKGLLHSTPNHRVELRKMSAKVAKGELKIDGYFNGANPDSIYLSSEVEINHMDLEKLFFKFDNFGQDFLLQENIKGQITGKIKSKVLIHSDLSIDLHRTNAHVEAKIENGEIRNFEPLKAMESYMGDKNLNRVRFDKIENVLDIKNGVVHIPKMLINSSLGYMLIDGRQNADMNMDYQVQVPLKMVKQAIVNTLFKRKKKADGTEEALSEDELPTDEIVSRPEGGSGAYIYVHILGKPDSYKIKTGKRK